MRFTERLIGLRDWTYHTLCEGRVMKAPGENYDVTEIKRQEPRCYLVWYPTRKDQVGRQEVDPISVCPAIVIMPVQSMMEYVEEKRWDRTNNVHRPQELGQELAVQLLMSVYEPGIRYPGFVETAEDGDGSEDNPIIDLTKLGEGTEQGLMTLMNWMDDCVQSLIAAKGIPGTDLFLKAAESSYSLYSDQNFIVDKRPVYYGYITARFSCYAENMINGDVQSLLE